MKLRDRLHRQLEHWRYRYGPKVVDALVAASTWAAQAKLREGGTVSVLVDNNVLGHAVTHETSWVSTGTSDWGNFRKVNTGYAARIAVYADDDLSETHMNVSFLPGIIQLARCGLVKLKTSAELLAEQFHQPIGRFRGYGYFDHSLFDGIELEPVDSFVFPILGPQCTNSRDQQLERIENASDQLYQALKRELGAKNSLDAWHIRTAEAHQIEYFLTMDFSLLRAIESRNSREPFTSLKTKIVTPRQFGEQFDLMRISPTLYSYHNASFIVRPDLNWGTGKRNKPKRPAP